MNTDLAQYNKLKGARSNYEYRWQQVSNYVSPSQDFTTLRTPGTERGEFIYDITARTANETLIAGLHGLLTSPYMRWATFYTENRDIEAQRWLKGLEDYIFRNVFDSLFNAQMHEFYRDLVTYGTGIMHIRWQDDRIYFRARPLSTCYIQEDHNGLIDTLYRQVEMPAYQVLQMFPDLGPERNARKVDPNSMIRIMQVTTPRKGEQTYVGGVATKKPYKVCYYDLAEKEPLAESGFDYFPFIVARFTKRVGEIYGDCPALQALPAIKSINMVAEFGIRGLMKNVDPTLLMDDDSSLGNKPVVQNPGSIIYKRAGADIRPLMTNPNPNFAVEFIEYLRRDIMKMFHVDWFDAPVQPNMTATEFIRRQQEGMRKLSPVLSRIENEALQPIIETVIRLVLENKLYPPPPVADLNYEIKYMSPIAQAQSAVEADSVMQTLAFYGQVMQLTQSASVMDNLDINKLARKIPLDTFRLSPEFMKTEGEVRRAQQAQAQEQQAMQAMQMAEPITKSIKNLAEAGVA